MTEPSTGPKPGFDRRLLPPMLLGSVLNPINSTIVSVALVPIANALGAPVSQTAWLVSALYLATSLGQPVVGRLIDIFGPRRLFLLSTALVGVAGVVGTLAPNLGVLIFARVLLGFGTCAGYPAAMALLRSEAKRTGQDNPGGVLTALAVANQTIAVIGPLLGGLLIAVGGWRATFALNVPLAVVAVVLGLLRLPKVTEVGESSQRGRLVARLDLPGMGLFAAMLTSLLLFLMNPHLRDWYLPAITIAAGAAFAVRELRAATPFIDLRVLGGNTPLLATYGRALVAYVVAYAFLYGFTQWTEEGYGLTPFHAGLAQIPMFLLAIGASIVSGRRKGVRGKLLVGAAGQIVACVVLLTLTGESPLWTLLLVALIFGVPQGLNNLALQNSVYFQADPDRIASSAGLLRTFAYIGSMIASSASAASFGQHADTAGMHRLAWIMLGAGVLYLLLTVFDRTLGRVAKPREQPHPDEKGTTMSRTALLLMDLQIHHLEHLTDDYLPRAVHALETARAAGVPVIHVTLRLRAGHTDAHPRNKIFGGLPPHLFTADDPGAAIHPDVAPAEGELVVHKNRVSAFAGNNLQQILAAQDIDHLVLAGIATGGIVLSTALQAADLDYGVTVLSDACADPNPALHDTLITEVLTRRGEVATVDEWARSLTAATTSA
jgi:nicotinamidase-related amidase/MFS family permease